MSRQRAVTRRVSTGATGRAERHPALADAGRRPRSDPGIRDLHCHSRGSFDCLSDPKDLVKAASDRGLTHLAITDHDRIDVAIEARDLAPAGLTVIVGEEVKTLEGDLICLFLEQAIPPGLPVVEAIAAARDQGGLVGIPHPFDSRAALSPARCRDGGPRPAGRLGRDATTPAWSATATTTPRRSRWSMACPASPSRTPIRSWRSGSPTAHSTATRRRRPACSPRCRSVEIIPGRASYLVRLWTPFAKGVNRVRGNRRVPAGPPEGPEPGTDHRP